MQIAKEQIVDLLKYQGDDVRASKAESELPPKVDPNKDSDLLAKIGIDPEELSRILPGNFGG